MEKVRIYVYALITCAYTLVSVGLFSALLLELLFNCFEYNSFTLIMFGLVSNVSSWVAVVFLSKWANAIADADIEY